MSRIPSLAILGLAILGASGFAAARKDDYLAGYLIIPFRDKAPKEFNAGYSMYVAAWPLQRAYPGHQYQTGLPGTWMFAQYDGAAPKDMYSDVEGGLGWWRDTRFPSETPKFIMGGVGPNFSNIANGPAHGWGTWDKPRGLYGVAQLSPWVLFPIDGLNVKQGTCGELFGYGYLSLPLCEPKATTEGKDVPTGGQTWTLFLNTKNFKGPLAFFLPNFWSQSVAKDPKLAGQLLDTRPSEPNRHVQMETQYIPCKLAKDAKGESYARIGTTQFPRGADGRSVLVHQDTVYNSSALWNSVETWFKGGPQPTGAFNADGAFVRPFNGGGSATWQIYTPGPDGKETKTPIAWPSFAKPFAIDAKTFGYQFNGTAGSDPRMVSLPEYFHLETSPNGKQSKWVPVPVDQVPNETGLQAIKWTRPVEKPEEPYLTPGEVKSSWKVPGPVAGPFKAHLGDGSVVTYYWYRFADQPALLNADLTPAERERLQAKVVKMHRAWTKDRDYIAPPTTGTLASLDPAQIVKPPKGLEVGYVPIATKQELEKK
jgi:hypothetical protein